MPGQTASACELCRELTVGGSAAVGMRWGAGAQRKTAVVAVIMGHVVRKSGHFRPNCERRQSRQSVPVILSALSCTNGKKRPEGRLSPTLCC